MSRALLHKSRLDSLKDWLDQEGIEWRQGKGDGCQIIQISTVYGWSCIYDRLDAKEHYTNDKRLDGLVRRFIRETNKRHHYQ